MKQKLLIVKGYAKIPEHTSTGYNISRLIEEAEKLGIETSISDHNNIKVVINKNITNIYSSSKNMLSYDLVIFMSDITKFELGYPIISVLQSSTTRVLNINSYSFILCDFNKLSQLKILADNKISVPDTYVNNSYKEMYGTISDEIIVKPIRGTQGSNIATTSNKSISYMLERYKPEQILFQKKLPNKRDYRILVFGNQTFGMMERTARCDQLVTNYQAGGSIRHIYDERLEELAIKASKALHCEYCGVDIMMDINNQPQVLEVNRNARFEGFEKASGLNIAKEILMLLTKKD